MKRKKWPPLVNIKVNFDLVSTLYVSREALEFLKKAFPNYIYDEQKSHAYDSFCIDFRDKFTKEELQQVVTAIQEFNPEWIMYKGD